jgi:hypothetical protein
VPPALLPCESSFNETFFQFAGDPRGVLIAVTTAVKWKVLAVATCAPGSAAEGAAAIEPTATLIAPTKIMSPNFFIAPHRFICEWVTPSDIR